MPPAGQPLGGWLGMPAAGGSSLSADSELKKREIASKLDALSRRQAARENATGRLGVGNRQMLVARLKDLQREKAIKASAQAESQARGAGNGAPANSLSPQHSNLAWPHSSPTADAAASLEWSERLRQAKAKYWSNLDQMAPDWKANSQYRRMDQLAKYEKAIDALLARRQTASVAYAKERELQKLLTAKQLELHNLAAHEREEVRQRQLARGLLAPPAAAAHALARSPQMRPSSAHGSYAQASPAQHYSPQQQHFSPSHRSQAGAPTEYYQASAHHPSSRYSPSHHGAPSYDHGPSLAGMPSDAQLEYEAQQSRLATTSREVADLETWREELNAEARLRASRREERDMEGMREKRVALERRKAMEMEQEAHLRATMNQGRAIGASMVYSHAQSNGPLPLSQIAYVPPAHASSSSNYSRPAIDAAASSSILTRADPLPQSRFDQQQPAAASSSSYHPAASAQRQAEPSTYANPARHEIPDDSGSRSRSFSPHRSPFEGPADDPPAQSLSSLSASTNARAQQDAEADRARAQQQQQAHAQAEADYRREEQERLERQRANDSAREREHQQEQDRLREREQESAQLQQQQQERQREREAAQLEHQQQQQQRQREYEQEQEREHQRQRAESAAAAADAAASKAKADEEATRAAARAKADAQAAEASRKAAEQTQAQAQARRPTTPPSDSDEPASTAGFASLFGGGGLGFMGKGKKKVSSKPSPPPSRPATAPLTKPAKKKSGDSDDDTSEEDESELKMPAVAPSSTLSSAMLKKKPIAGRNARKPIWQTDADLDETDDFAGATTATGAKKGTLPEDDEFDF